MDKLENYEDCFNLQLIVTEDCNLRCLYCFEGSKGPKQMSIELAKQLLCRELNRDDGPNKYQIDLAGGEPLLNFENIKEIIEYCILNADKWKKEFFFNIGTNLTLLNQDIEHWLEKNRDFVILSISLDGTRDVHNYYRCGSYDSVISNLPIYRRLYPSQGAKMTIGPETIGSIYESILHIESLGLSPDANVVFEPVWGDIEKKKKKCLRDFASQLALLIGHYASNINLTIPNLLTLPIHKLVSENKEDNRWCGSGINMRAYDTDGRELPCHRFSRLASNKVYLGNESVGCRIQSKCDNCMYVAVCPTCRGYNWEIFGNPDSRTSYHCEFIKLQILATAKLQYLRNKSKIKSLIEDTLIDQDESIGVLKSLQAANIIFNRLDEEQIIAACEI